MKNGSDNITTDSTCGVRFLDLRLQNQDELHHLHTVLNQIAEHGIVVNGPEVASFENLTKQFFRCKYALGVGSGTDALITSLLTLGIGPGDEVIVPCLSFVGTASVISMVGATPCFVDIDWDYCIDPKHIIGAITPRTKAIMPVHFTGHMAKMDKIMEIAKEYHLAVIEDAAPAFGAEYLGKKAGTWGTFGCFSMNPMKVLGALGPAGLVVSNTSDLFQALQRQRYHNKDTELCFGPGINARMDGIQAAVLSYRLKKLPALLNRRREIARYYNDHLKMHCDIPYSENIETRVYYTYSILTQHRDKLMEFLGQHAIETKIQHRLLMPRHPVFQLHQQHKQPFEIGDVVADQLLCLPIHEKMTDSQVEKVVSISQKFFKKIHL